MRTIAFILLTALVQDPAPKPDPASPATPESTAPAPTAPVDPLAEAEAGIAKARETLAAREAALGAEHPEVAAALYDLAVQLAERGGHAEAKSLHERALAIREKALGAEHPAVAESLWRLGRLHRTLGEPAEAKTLQERALAIRERTYGPDHTAVAESLNDLAILARQRGDLELSQTLHERALAIREKAFGPEHPDVAESLANLALLLHDRRVLDEAQALCERSLAMREKLLGPEHTDVAGSLNTLGLIHQLRGRYEEARRCFERSLAIREKALGPDHPRLAPVVNNLAETLQLQGEYDESRRLHMRALAISEKAFGPDHPDSAYSLHNLSALHASLGEFDEARRLEERAIQITERAYGPEHPTVALSLNNLAVVCSDQGRFEDARRHFERALAIWERILGPEHTEVAIVLTNLGNSLHRRGKSEEALPLAERAIAILEKALGPEHYDLAGALALRSALEGDLGRHEESLRIWRRILEIEERTFGPDHERVSYTLSHIAGELQFLDRYDEARPLLERSLAIRESCFGAEHVSVAGALFDLGADSERRGELAAARGLYERSLAIRRRTYGDDHPDVILVRICLATLALEEGNADAAWGHAAAALDSSRAHRDLLLAEAAETDALIYSLQHCRAIQLLLGIAAANPAPERERAVHTAFLDWKGRVLRSHARARAELLAACPEDERARVARLRSIQSALSNLLSQRAIPDRTEHERNLERLRRERTSLESELLAGAGRLPGGPDPTPAALSAALPAGSVLLDFFVHRVWRPSERKDGAIVRDSGWGPPQVCAWVLRAGETQARRVDLGPSEALESAVEVFLVRSVPRGTGALEPAVTEAEESAAARLRRLLWEPIAEAVGDAPLVFVSPDSFLATLPFEIIETTAGKHLIEEHGFVYLESAASLVAPRATPASSPERGPSILIAGALDYDVGASPPEAGPLASAELRGSFEFDWIPLSETRREVDAIESLHRERFEDGGRLVLRESEGTEERLKHELPLHREIHLATHGYFEPDELPSMRERAGSAEGAPRGSGMSREERLLIGYLPGFLSGLVCAGANRPADPGRENGLLTAEEVAWLDLSRCDLVVLSACQTALGESSSGEGMLGLRRSFSQAGARTVVSSLWRVRDDSTRELMRRFYARRWERGEGKLAALRGAQLEMLAENRARFGDPLPAAWGAFVLSGDWR